MGQTYSLVYSDLISHVVSKSGEATKAVGKGWIDGCGSVWAVLINLRPYQPFCKANWPSSRSPVKRDSTLLYQAAWHVLLLWAATAWWGKYSSIFRQWQFCSWYCSHLDSRTTLKRRHLYGYLETLRLWFPVTALISINGSNISCILHAMKGTDCGEENCEPPFGTLFRLVAAAPSVL